MKLFMWLVLWIAGALMMTLVVVYVLGTSFELGLIQEDSLLFNCYFMGNLTWGPDVPWHGFVNF